MTTPMRDHDSQHEHGWNPERVGISPEAFETVTGQFRSLLSEDHDAPSADWRRSFAGTIDYARSNRLQPEHILIALKTEWRKVVGPDHRAEHDQRLGRLVSLCIQSYYSVDGNGRETISGADGDGGIAS